MDGHNIHTCPHCFGVYDCPNAKIRGAATCTLPHEWPCPVCQREGCEIPKKVTVASDEIIEYRSFVVEFLKWAYGVPGYKTRVQLEDMAARLLGKDWSEKLMNEGMRS